MRVPPEISGDVAAYATDEPRSLSRVVVWMGWGPHTGALLPPVVEACAAVHRDVIAVARPGFGDSPRLAGRNVAQGVAATVKLAERLNLEEVIWVGHSAGGPHALAAAAALPEVTRGVITFAAPAPFGPARRWFAGMVDAAPLRAATFGTESRAALRGDFDLNSFTAADYRALRGSWRDLGKDAEAGFGRGRLGMVDDDVALVSPWGFDLQDCRAPVQIVHGGADRVVPTMHALTLAAQLPTASATVHSLHGQVSVLEELPFHLPQLCGTLGLAARNGFRRRARARSPRISATPPGEG